MTRRRVVHAAVWDFIGKRGMFVQLEHNNMNELPGQNLVFLDPNDLCPVKEKCPFCLAAVKRVMSRTGFMSYATIGGALQNRR